MDSSKPKKQRRLLMVKTLIETFGWSPTLATVISVILMAIGLAAVAWIIRSAPPRTLVISSGPAGSSYQRYAERYQKGLAEHGVTLVIKPSNGSIDNLQRLQAADSGVDVGFVQAGRTGKETTFNGLVSLGSIAYQPLWVYYRGAVPVTRLSELAGKRIAVGPAGSGTRVLALALLAANGINGAPTTFVEQDSAEAAADLLAAKLDAVFLMGDSASTQTLISLGRSADVRMFNFAQADAYVRRFSYLSKMTLPEGSLDLGKNVPAQDVELLAPTVDLVAREGLNSALSDLLLDVAQDVHGRPGLLQTRGEFPAPRERDDLKMSADALRYYKAGKGFTYRMIDSFWLASLLNRILVAVVPLVLVLIPTLKILPFMYRWSIQIRIYRCYRPLLRLERELQHGTLSKEDAGELLKRLDEIEDSVTHLKVPASFAFAFYELRGHVGFVRKRLQDAASAASGTAA